jgi:hypothetical protein
VKTREFRWLNCLGIVRDFGKGLCDDRHFPELHSLTGNLG